MLNEKAQDLRDQMVINKALNPNRSISVKSWIIFFITWTLWLTALYYLVRNSQEVFNTTIVGGWTMLELIKGVCSILRIQLNILFIWSNIGVRKVNQRRKQRMSALRVRQAIEEIHYPKITPQPRRKRSNTDIR